MIDALRSDISAAAKSVEWVVRLGHLEGGGHEEGSVGLDRQLDRIGPDNRSFAAHRVCSEEEVETGVRSAPRSTRADIRGRFIEACKSARRDHTVDWMHLKLYGEPGGTVILSDPLQVQDPRIERFLGLVDGERQ